MSLSTQLYRNTWCRHHYLSTSSVNCCWRNLTMWRRWDCQDDVKSRTRTRRWREVCPQWPHRSRWGHPWSTVGVTKGFAWWLGPVAGGLWTIKLTCDDWGLWRGSVETQINVWWLESVENKIKVRWQGSVQNQIDVWWLGPVENQIIVWWLGSVEIKLTCDDWDLMSVEPDVCRTSS